MGQPGARRTLGRHGAMTGFEDSGQQQALFPIRPLRRRPANAGERELVVSDEELDLCTALQNIGFGEDARREPAEVAARPREGLFRAVDAAADLSEAFLDTRAASDAGDVGPASFVESNGIIGVMSSELDDWRTVLQLFVSSRRATGGVFANDAATSREITLTDDVVCRVRDAFAQSEEKLGVALAQVMNAVLGTDSDPGPYARQRMVSQFRGLFFFGQSQQGGRRLGD